MTAPRTPVGLQAWPGDRVQAVEQIVALTAWDPLLSLKALAAYTSLSTRMLRGFLRDLANPLPHYRVGGRILIRRSEFDSWLQVFRQGGDDAEEIAGRILSSLDQPGGPTQTRGAAR